MSQTLRSAPILSEVLCGWIKLCNDFGLSPKFQNLSRQSSFTCASHAAASQANDLGWGKATNWLLEAAVRAGRVMALH